MRDRPVAVDFLKSDFPFVVAFDSVEGHHRIQSAFEPLLACVVESTRQLLMTVAQQLAGDFRIGYGKVHRHHVCLRIPIGGAAVFLAGEAFRTDVQAFVFSVISRKKLEKIEADPLLCFVVAQYFHVRFRPSRFPSTFMRGEKPVVAFPSSFSCHLFGDERLLGIRNVPAGDDSDTLVQNDLFARGNESRKSFFY